LILKTEKNLWPLAQAENCRLALGLKRLDTPGLDALPNTTNGLYWGTNMHDFVLIKTLCIFEFAKFQLPTIHGKQVLSNITNM